MTYKIVERLLVPISDGNNTTTGTRPMEGWKPPYEPYVPRIQREAALLIQELGEALERAHGYVQDGVTDELHEVDKFRDHPALLRKATARWGSAKEDLAKIDAILSKLKDES